MVAIELTFCVILSRWRATYRPPSVSAMTTLALFLFLWLVLSPLVLGLLFELTLVVPSQVWAQEGIKCLSPGRDWALGILLLHFGVCLGLAGLLDIPAPGGNHLVQTPLVVSRCLTLSLLVG